MSIIDTYHSSLRQHAAGRGLTMNPDWDVVEPLLQGLLVNGDRYGYRTCPCRPASGEIEKDRDIICPCEYAQADVEEYGACYCWLFVSDEWIHETIAHRQIPERRPPEKILA